MWRTVLRLKRTHTLQVLESVSSLSHLSFKCSLNSKRKWLTKYNDVRAEHNILAGRKTIDVCRGRQLRMAPKSRKVNNPLKPSCIQRYTVTTRLILQYDWQQCHSVLLIHYSWRAKPLLEWRGGSLGRASDSRCKDPRFESRQEHKNILWLFPSQKCYANLLSVCPTPRVYKNKNDHVRTLHNKSIAHVRVGWITETRKESACTCRTG